MPLALLAHQEAAAGGPDPWLVAAGVLLGAAGLVWLARSGARSVAAAVLAGIGCTLVAVAVLGHRHGVVAPAPALAVGDLACPVASGGDRSAALLDPPPKGFVPSLNDAVPATQTLTDCRAREVEVDGQGTATVAVGRLDPGALDLDVELRPEGSTPVRAGGVEARVLAGFEQGAPPVVQWVVDDVVVLAELDAGESGDLDDPLARVEALVGGIEVSARGGVPTISVAAGADLRLGAEVPPATWAINGAARHLVRYAATDGESTGLGGDEAGASPAVSVETVHLAGEADLLDRALDAAGRGAGQADPVAVGEVDGSLVTTDAGTTVVAAGGAQELVVVRGLSVPDDLIIDAAADVSLVRASDAEDAAPVTDLAGPIEREADGSFERDPSTPVVLLAVVYAAPLALLGVGLALWRWRRRAR